MRGTIFGHRTRRQAAAGKAEGAPQADEVADVLNALISTGRHPYLSLTGAGADRVIVVNEDDMDSRTLLTAFTEDLEDAGVGGHPESLCPAVSTWLDHRPVSSAEAKNSGYAVLTWTDQSSTKLAWSVACQRSSTTMFWHPPASLPAEEIQQIRRACRQRSAQADLRTDVHGDVALWTCPAMPVLATAVLLSPQRILTVMSSHNLQQDNLQAVLSPPHSLAVTHKAAALRLSTETTEPSVVLAVGAALDLEWN